jgi:hypothetical protein
MRGLGLLVVVSLPILAMFLAALIYVLVARPEASDSRIPSAPEQTSIRPTAASTSAADVTPEAPTPAERLKNADRMTCTQERSAGQDDKALCMFFSD